MAIRQGNQGIVTDGLQLYYNRELQTSFRGEPTVNFFSVPNYTLQKEDTDDE